MSPRTKPTSTVALLFWLMLVISLAGVSFQRQDALDQVGALWAGTLVGALGGQLVAKLRIRAWVFGAIGMVALWSAPVFFFMIYDSGRPAAELCLFAAAPAFACGYFSLSERWGLASFWYPAMLWMLVVLDGTGRFDAVAALPLLLGLGAMFMAFFRARETRRVALWQSYGLTRLAKPVARHVLRVSPARAASQWIFAGLIGSGALALTAIIAPQLWQKQQIKERAAREASAVALSDWYASQNGGDVPCCHSTEQTETSLSHPREYVALRKNTTEEDRRQTMLGAMSCRSCADTTGSDPEVGGGGYVWNRTGRSGGGYGSGYSSNYGGGYGNYGGNGYGNYGGGYGQAYVPPQPQPQPPVNPYTVQEPAPVAQAPVVSPKSYHVSRPNPVVPVAPFHASATRGPVTPVNDPIVSSHSRPVAVPRPAAWAALAPPPDDEELDIPWRSALAFGLLGFSAHLFLRALRRQLRLRHLARPFWRSPVDQRISNLWERMLIGLRDAGIQPREGEQPQALAKRVGLPGMDVCATILERVRHGVRLEASDLESMQSASISAFTAARTRAGAFARAAAMVRPLA